MVDDICEMWAIWSVELDSKMSCILASYRCYMVDARSLSNLLECVSKGARPNIRFYKSFQASIRDDLCRACMDEEMFRYVEGSASCNRNISTKLQMALTMTSVCHF